MVLFIIIWLSVWSFGGIIWVGIYLGVPTNYLDWTEEYPIRARRYLLMFMLGPFGCVVIFVGALFSHITTIPNSNKRMMNWFKDE